MEFTVKKCNYLPLNKPVSVPTLKSCDETSASAITIDFLAIDNSILFYSAEINSLIEVYYDRNILQSNCLVFFFFARAKKKKIQNAERTVPIYVGNWYAMY